MSGFWRFLEIGGGRVVEIGLLLVVFAYWKWKYPQAVAALIDYLGFGSAGDERATSGDST